MRPVIAQPSAGSGTKSTMADSTDIRRVGVILGGRSSEREVSLASGRQVYLNLDRSRWAGVPLFMDGDGRLWRLPDKLVYQNTCVDIEGRLDQDAERVPLEGLPELVDLVFIALHGKYGDDGCIQGALELLDLPYTGSGVLTCALAQDKPLAHAVLEEAGLGRPRERAVRRADYDGDPDAAIAALVAEPGLPLVVLPAREGSSVGVSVVREAEALPEALATAFEWDDRALVEEFLDGMEFSVIVLEDEAGEPAPLLPTETVTESPFLTYDDKYMPGRSQKITPARVDEATLKRIQDRASAVFRTLGFRGYARLDGFLMPDGRLLFTDPNRDLWHVALLLPLPPGRRGRHDRRDGHRPHPGRRPPRPRTQARPAVSENGTEDLSRIQAQSPQKTRVAVGLGGRSSEREISLESGRHIVQTLGPLAVRAGRVVHGRLRRAVGASDCRCSCRTRRATSTNGWPRMPSACPTRAWPRSATSSTPACTASTARTAASKACSSCWTCPTSAAACWAAPWAWTRAMQRHVLREAGVETPLTREVRAAEWARAADAVVAEVAAAPGFPCVVKPAREGCSTALSVPRDEAALRAAIEEALRWDPTALVEEHLSGMEVTVAVLEEADGSIRAYPPTETPPVGDFLDDRGEVPARAWREHYPGPARRGDDGRRGRDGRARLPGVAAAGLRAHGHVRPARGAHPARRAEHPARLEPQLDDLPGGRWRRAFPPTPCSRAT